MLDTTKNKIALILLVSLVIIFFVFFITNDINRRNNRLDDWKAIGELDEQNIQICKEICDSKGYTYYTKEEGCVCSTPDGDLKYYSLSHN